MGRIDSGMDGGRFGHALKRLLDVRIGAVLVVWLIISFSMISILLQAANALESSVNLSTNEGTSASPRIAASGSNIYITWQDDDSGDFDILFAASTDNGVTFGEPINVSNNDGFSFNPQVSASGDNVYIVWQDSSPGSDDILFTASTDNGVTFSEPVNISSNDGTSSSPQLAVSGDDVYITWQDDDSGDFDILFAASTDNGSTFNEPINVSNNDGTSSSPQIAASGNDVYIVWQDDDSGDFDILFAASTDGGAAFGSIVNISNNTGTSLTQQIAASGSNVYIVWQDDDSGDFDILFAASTDNGSTFNEPINVSNNSGFSVTPRLAASENNVYIVWSDDTDVSSGFDILFAASTDNGVTFGEPVNVSNNDGTSTAPLLTVSSTGANIYTIWSDNEIDLSNDEIYLSASTDNGATFGCPINLSSDSGSSSSPQMALANDGTNVHTTWQDLTTGNFEVLALSNVDPLDEVIVVNPLANSSPKWEIDQIEVSGTVANAADDTVTVDWGDGTQTEDVPISSCSWGPVSHSYDSSAVDLNPNMLVARLIAADDTEKAVSLETEVNVQKHSTTLLLNPVASVIQGTDVTVTGSLVDADTGGPLEGMTITFTGSGAGDVPSVSTDAGGLFSSSGPSVNTAEDGLEVQARFDGTSIYEPADSDIKTYDTADLSATQFDVAAGSSTVDLTGFNASIQFEDVISDGVLFVSACDPPDSDRFIALDNMCLRISPGVQMADGSSAIVSMSYAGKEIPEGYTASDIDLFHEVVTDGSTIVDVTQSRDEENQSVAGRVSSFSNFIGGIALHDEKPLGAHRTQIFVGDDNVVSLRDINNQQDSSATATISLDKTRYRMSDNPIITISDSNGNVDPAEVDIVYAGVMSETSNPFAIGVTLIETGVDAGVFEGSFGFTSGESSTPDALLQVRSGDELSIFYVSGARFEAAIDGVIESGLVELSDYVVEEGVCFAPVGGAVDLRLVDSQIGPDGRITATISYSNAFLEGIDPSSLRMVHKEDLTWVDVTVDPGGYNPDAKTITGETSSTGPFSLATNVGDCGGGAGGGGGFGRGVVVDSVASLVSRSGGGGGGGGSSSGSTSTKAGTALPTGRDIVSTTSVGSETVIVKFDMIESSTGPLTIKSVNVGEIKQLFDEVRVEQNEEQGVLDLDDAVYSTAGTVFDIDSSAVKFEGMADVTIPYDEGLAMSYGPESNIRFLHYDAGRNEWTDDTIAINTSANTVSGRVSSLSPVVAAVVEDGTFDIKYFEYHPLMKIADIGEDAISILDSNGVKITTAEVSENVTVTNAIKNLQRTSQSYTYVIEVFDSENVAVDLTIGTGTLDRGQVTTLTDEWTAEREGTYTIKIFLVDDLSAPAPVILKNPSTVKLGVT